AGWSQPQLTPRSSLSRTDVTYERLSVGGLPYFVNGLGGNSIYAFGTPLAGSQVRYNADYGAMRVRVDAAQMTLEFFSRTGALVDSFVVVAQRLYLPLVHR
ncbi:MAG: hypothetical protein ACT4QE_04605, partial [Anaerolineales bacterium]